MTRRLPVYLSWCVVIAALASCATAANYEKMLNSWMGHGENELLNSWGPPDNVYESGDIKYLTYARGGTVVLPGTAPSYQSTFVGNTMYSNPVGGTPPLLINKHCKTTFTIQNSAIVSWRWEGNACKA